MNNEIKALMEEASRVRREWRQTNNLFNNTDDPDLIDCAIYRQEAAKKQYLYLTRKIKQLQSQDEGIA